MKTLLIVTILLAPSITLSKEENFYFHYAKDHLFSTPKSGTPYITRVSLQDFSKHDPKTVDKITVRIEGDKLIMETYEGRIETPIPPVVCGEARPEGGYNPPN